MPVADALSAVLAGAEPLPEEMVALDEAHRRVLARDVAALRTQPPQAMSAMDGYAVRSADASHVAARLKVIGEVAAGRPFERAVGAGEAGASLPVGLFPTVPTLSSSRKIPSLKGTVSPSPKPRFRDGISAPQGSTSARAMCCWPPVAASPTVISRSPPA